MPLPNDQTLQIRDWTLQRILQIRWIYLWSSIPMGFKDNRARLTSCRSNRFRPFTYKPDVPGAEKL